MTTPPASSRPAAARRRAASHRPRGARRRLHEARDRLRAAYGRPLPRPHRAPVDELILTVLSQSTNDRNRDVAFQRLRARFPDWAAVRDAPESAVEEAIRPGGISRVKSQRIQAILRALDGDDLCWLESAPLEDAREYLCSLPGVGRKTAACVLLFAFDRPEIPVDTHVFRVLGRLGVLRAGVSLEEAHDELLHLSEPGEAYELHMVLLRHGRRTCTARSPACPACPLLAVCPYGRRRGGTSRRARA